MCDRLIVSKVDKYVVRPIFVLYNVDITVNMNSQKLYKKNINYIVILYLSTSLGK